MKSNEFDMSLINHFRNIVNDKWYVLSKYQNVNGKNLWNCICSSMDWITVSMEYIIDVKQGKATFNHSMEWYAYISAIDNILESVKQLHRVFIGSEKFPFDGKNDIFKNKYIKSKDDNIYFKEIRAIFGAHPVNLDLKINENTNTKFFASWSGVSYTGKGDYTVMLYSNNIDTSNKLMVFGIYFSELDLFLKERYEYLNVIAEKIKKGYNDYINNMRKIIIRKSSDAIEQINILRQASNERLNIYRIDYLLSILEIIYNTNVSNSKNADMVVNYKQDLLVDIEKIRLYLQNMNLDEDLNCNILEESIDIISDKYMYYHEKLSNSLFHDNDYYVDDFIIQGIKKIFYNKFIFEFSSNKELYVLIKATIHQEYLKSKPPVKRVVCTPL